MITVKAVNGFVRLFSVELPDVALVAKKINHCVRSDAKIVVVVGMMHVTLCYMAMEPVNLHTAWETLMRS